MNRLRTLLWKDWFSSTTKGSRMKTFPMLALLFACMLLQCECLVGDDLAADFLSTESEMVAGMETTSGAHIRCDCARCCKLSSEGPQKPWSLFGNCCGLNSLGIKIGGYIQQSAVTDSRNPTNPPASFGAWPGAGFLYRNDEYMFNRLYLNIERPTDTSCRDWDIGGKVDLLYGTDYVFLQARGLETRSDLSPKWNPASGVGFGGVGLMGLAMPQLYAEVAYRDTKVKLGHFYHPGGFIGFDPVKGVLGNTNTYTLIYNSNLPVTGALAEWSASDQLTLGGGFHRGSANWEDNND